MVYITQNLNWLKISILKATQIIIWYRKEKLQGLEGGDLQVEMVVVRCRKETVFWDVNTIDT